MPTVFNTVPGSGNIADKSDDILDPLPRKKNAYAGLHSILGS